MKPTRLDHGNNHRTKHEWKESRTIYVSISASAAVMFLLVVFSFVPSIYYAPKVFEHFEILPYPSASLWGYLTANKKIFLFHVVCVYFTGSSSTLFLPSSRSIKHVRGIYIYAQISAVKYQQVSLARFQVRSWRWINYQNVGSFLTLCLIFRI